MSYLSIPDLPSGSAGTPGLMRQAVLSLLALTVVACDGGIYLRARVLGADRVPIEGATVTLSNEAARAEAVTGVDGCVDLGGVVAPGRYSFSVTATAPGRKPLATKVKTLTDNRCDLVLVAEGHDGDSLAVCTTDGDDPGWQRQCPSPAWATVEWE